MPGLNWLSIEDAHAQLTLRQISSVELTQACLDRIDAVEDRVQSFLTLTPEIALAQAEQADRMLAAAEKSGIQFLINWPNRWRPNTIQSWKLLQDGAVGEIFTARRRRTTGRSRPWPVICAVKPPGLLNSRELRCLPAR